jgi:uncharacterized SAM-binding protein YcdF (DUF218 family)
MPLFQTLIAAALLPLTLVTLCVVLGLVLVWSGRERGGKIALTIGVLLLLVTGLRFVPAALLRSLESAYQPIGMEAGKELPPVKWIVVLGGGHNPNPSLPATSRISAPSLSRLAEGIRLHRRIPGSRLFFTGAALTPEGGSDAGVMREVALDLGVPGGEIEIDEHSLNTEEEAHAAARLTGTAPSILVTSAWHMPRAAALFRRAGGNPIPAPVDYLIRSGAVTERNFYPTVEGLEGTRIALHEYGGWLWAKLRGKV